METNNTDIQRHQEQFENIFKIRMTTNLPFSQEEITTITTLLEQGANPNQKVIVSSRGALSWTSIPLLIGCDKKEPELVNVLLQHKAQPNNLHKNATILSHVCNQYISSKDINEKNKPAVKKIIYNLISHGATLNILHAPNSSKFSSDSALHSTINQHQFRWIISLLVKKDIVIPIDRIDDQIEKFIELKKDIRKPLSITFFYDNKQHTNNITITFPQEIIHTIFDMYSTLLTYERSEHWLPACKSIYPEKPKNALSFLPFMTEKKQWKLCKNYYFNTQNLQLLSNQEKK